jgi:hypothetical protein
VFLVESLDAEHEDMKHLKAVVFCRPTRDNLACLKSILREPKFSEYNICACALSRRHGRTAGDSDWRCRAWRVYLCAACVRRGVAQSFPTSCRRTSSSSSRRRTSDRLCTRCRSTTRTSTPSTVTFSPLTWAAGVPVFMPLAVVRRGLMPFPVFAS